MFAIPNVLIFQILFPLISPVMDLLMVWSLAAAGWARYQHPLDYTTETLQRVLFYYALFFTLIFSLHLSPSCWSVRKTGVFSSGWCFNGFCIGS